ncbi:MAG: phage tail protein [Melioribacteraceae bacterium]
MISIRTNIAKFINTELRDVKNAVNKATLSATTKTARQGATEGKSAVRETYNIPASELNKATKIVSANANDPTAKIRVTGKPISLDKFKARWKRKNTAGATAEIIKGKRVVIPGDKGEGTKTFIATMKSGHTGIFYRISKKRLKIWERKGPSAPDLMSSRRAIDAIRLYVKTNYERIFNSEYKFFKSK